jgi:integrase
VTNRKYQQNGGVQPRGENTWRLTYRDYRETFHGSKTDAKKRRAKIVAEYEEGTLATRGPETVEALVERYIAHRISTGHLREGKPANTYRSYFRNHVPGSIAAAKVADVRPVACQRIIDGMLANGLAPSSVRQLGALLHGSFKFAVRQRDIAVNPMDGVTLPTARRGNVVTPKAADIAQILSHVEPRYQLPLTLSAATGARRGEVCALRWSDTHLDGNHESCPLNGVAHVHVAGTMQRVDGKLTRMHPKTPSGRRGVPLAPFAVAALERYRAEQLRRRIKLGPAWRDEDLIVDGGHGHPIDPDNLGDAFRRAARAAGLDSVRLHDLRHAWATSMIAAKQSPAAVAAFLGHSQVSFTLTTYVHADADMAAPVAEAAEAALGAALANR